MGDHITLPRPLNPIEKLCKEIAIEIPDDLETTFHPEICIYQVPATLRDLNEAAYTPRVVSIGPIHYDNEALKAMEIQKRRYLKEFCNRLSLQKNEQQQQFLTEILKTIKDQEVAIRRCYADDTSSTLGADQFVKMVLLDAVFIFELFLKNREFVLDNSKYQNDFIKGKPWLRDVIRRDLILLENQLPFSVLEKLYNLATANSKMVSCLSFLELSCQYFKKFDKNGSKPNGTLHFTDLVRHFLSFRHPEIKSPDGVPVKNLYSATMLHQAGLKFKALPDECLLGIRAWNSFPEDQTRYHSVKKGELHMPTFEIDSNTECLCRNLMALERCHYPREQYICRYVKLLDFLVNVAEDVDLLIENKIMVSKLGDSGAVTKLINRLCREMVEVPSSYDIICKQLNDYYESSWNKNKAYFVSVYFKNVWIGTGTIAGSIILAITIFRFILDMITRY